MKCQTFFGRILRAFCWQSISLSLCSLIARTREIDIKYHCLPWWESHRLEGLFRQLIILCIRNWKIIINGPFSRMKMLFAPHDLLNVFMTYKEFAVINAIKRLYPEARHMLCTFHISRNVQQHCKPNFKSDIIQEKFIHSWTNVTKVIS